MAKGSSARRLEALLNTLLYISATLNVLPLSQRRSLHLHSQRETGAVELSCGALGMVCGGVLEGSKGFLLFSSCLILFSDKDLSPSGVSFIFVVVNGD